MYILSGYKPGPEFDHIVAAAWGGRTMLHEQRVRLGALFKDAPDVLALIQLMTSAPAPHTLRVLELGACADRDVRSSFRELSETFAESLRPESERLFTLSSRDKDRELQVSKTLSIAGSKFGFKVDRVRVFSLSGGQSLIRFSASKEGFAGYLWVRVGPDGDIIVACDAIHTSLIKRPPE